MARTTSRALLIGCDFYFASDGEDHDQITFPHLHGAVQDVENIENFLLRIGVPEKNIVKLTASYDPHFPEHPTEDKKWWPTHANIVRELEAITNQNDPPGTLVYIHFSGHGILRGRLSNAKMSLEGDTLFGAALATTDVLQAHGRYLTTNELGLRIKALVTKGPRVTLVLDACYSGRGLRKNVDLSTSEAKTFTLRTSPNGWDVGNIDDDEALVNNAFELLARISGTRQAAVKEDWLSKPEGCTVLTACGIQQTAGENVFQDPRSEKRVWRGVFTHWMLEFLNQTWMKTSSLPSHEAVVEYIKTKIQVTLPQAQQLPSLYGDAAYEFFGAKQCMKRPKCQVTEKWDGDKVRLNVGSAQGVAKGALYDIYPADVDIENSHNLDLALEARIVKTNDFHSVALLTGNGKNKDLNQLNTRDDHIGVLRSWALKETVLVRFMSNELNMREALRNHLERTPNLTLATEHDHEVSLVVKIDGSDNFEIFQYFSDNSEEVKLQRLPVIAVHAELAIPKLAHLLRHISRFLEIRKIEYHTRNERIQEDKLDVTFSRGTKRLLPEEISGIPTFKVIEGETLGFRVRYSGPQSFVWAAFFELSPSWGISRKFATKLVKDQYEPDEYSSKPMDFTTSIPPKCTAGDSEDTSDTFMVFISEGEGEQSWDEIMLDELPTDAGDLRIDISVRDYVDANKRSEIVPSKLLTERDWGVCLFVVHSFPKNQSGECQENS